MDKRRAIRIMTNAAKMYHENLEDQKVIFLYGIPSEVKMQMGSKDKTLNGIRSYEVAFHRYNFLHITGVKISSKEIKSAIHFYEKCLSNRLKESDFAFSKDGSTIQKLDVLESMMLIKRNATMIGDFSDRGPKLYSEKVAGNVCACVGFVKDKNSNLNVPNTLIKKDIRDVTSIPTQKIFGIMSKKFNEDKYYIIDKMDKSISINEYSFSQDVEDKINRKAIQGG